MCKPRSEKDLRPQTGKVKSAKSIQRLSKALANADSAAVAQCMKNIEKQCGRRFAAFVKL